MENKDNSGRWLSDRLSTLQPNDYWQPDLAHGLLRFRVGQRMRHARERRMIGIGFGTVAVIAVLLAFPATRTLAERYVSACTKLLATFSDSPTDLADRNVDDRLRVPDFALTDAAGALTKVRDLKGKVVLLTFWTANCETCDTEMSWFREFEQTYGQNNLVFLNHQVVRGQSDDVARLFGGLNVIPTTFLIDKSGRIAVTHGGFCARSEFDTAIKALLNERSQ